MGNQNRDTREIEDGIVILMDPDMILLRPILHDFSDADNHIWVLPPLPDNATDGGAAGRKKQKQRRYGEPLTRIVRHGYPMAQQDGYLNNEWMFLDMAHITNLTAGQFIPRPERQDGPVFWNTGPPYLATVRDMYRIAVKWTEYTPRVLDIYPKLFGEMYGFIHATVQLQLPFTLVKSMVVSTTTSR